MLAFFCRGLQRSSQHKCLLWRNMSTSSTSPEGAHDVKPYSAIPMKKGLPFLGRSLDYIGQDVRDKPHKVLFTRVNELGPIFRERVVSTLPEMLIVCDPNDVEIVFRADGVWPIRPNIPVWEELRKLQKIPLGMFLSTNYEEWYRQRRPVSQFMMKPPKVAEYHENFNQVSADLLKAIRQVRDPESYILQDVPSLLFKWSFESIAYFVLGKRLGCLNIGNIPELCQDFIDQIQDFLTATQDILFSLPLHKVYATKAWKKLYRAHKRTYEISLKHISDKMEQIKEKDEELLTNDEVPEKVDFLTYMIHRGELSIEEISINAADLLIAGIDTTSYTLVWCLYCLATNPEVQVKLRDEVMQVVGDNEIVTPAHIHSMPYLRNCIKETLRLYPLAPNNTRIVKEDIILSGYKVPKDTYVVMSNFGMGRLPYLFPEPEDFKPERWEKSSIDLPHQFASLPFGFGPRMCVGRRVAELELHIALSHIINNFKIGYHEGTPIEPIQKVFTLPERQVNLSFQEV